MANLENAVNETPEDAQVNNEERNVPSEIGLATNQTVETVEVIRCALHDYYQKMYKNYNNSNSLPVTDADFDELREKATIIRNIKEACNNYEV